MSFVNIGGDKNDDSYRYKMPVLQCTTEGRGNGLKTAFVNIADVAKSLHVMPQYIMKYLGFELGTRSSYDEATSKGIVDGKHDISLCQALMDKFIDAFVLCPKCKLPEINMSVQKSDQIRITCAACGDKRPLKSIHKLTHYIISHPPPKKTASGAHRNAEKEKLKQDAATTVVQPIEKKEIEWHSEASVEAQRERLKRDIGEQSTDEAKRLAKINAIMKAASEIGAEKTPSTLLNVFLIQSDRSINAIYDEIRRLQLSRGLDESQKYKLLLEVFVDASDPKQVAKQFSIPRTKSLINKFVNKNTAAAVIFINCIEDFVGVIHPKLLVYFPLILKQCFEEDILTQEQILYWFNQSVESSWIVQVDIARQTRAKSQPLIDWLQDDDEDDDEDEDE